jgi:FMN phosphatase YigB (HAD superfamily)
MLGKSKTMKCNGDNVRFIFFDLGGTLVHIKPNLQVDTVKRIACACGQTLIDKRQIDQAIISYEAACSAEWETRFTDILKVRTEADEREYWPGFVRSVLRRLGVASPEAELVELLAKRSADSKSFTRFSDTLFILKRLKNCYGFKLGIISNAFPSAEKVLDELELTPLFNLRVLSHKLSCVKPSSQIYLDAAGL